MLNLDEEITREVFLKRAGLGALGLLAFGSTVARQAYTHNRENWKKHSSGVYNDGPYS